MPPDPGGRNMPRLESKPRREEHNGVRAEQTVSEMAVESLARWAETLSDETKQPFEEAFAKVLKTPAGRKLAALADGPHRHEKAAQWQARLIADREAQRPAHLRSGQDRKSTRLN